MRNQMRRSGIANDNIMQSSDDMLSKELVLLISRQNSPILHGMEEIVDASWDYVGHGAPGIKYYVAGIAKTGETIGKFGTLVKNPNLKVDWAKSMGHAGERMAERGATQSMVNSYVANGRVFSQNNGSKYLFFSREGAAVVAKDGKLITVIPKTNYDGGYRELTKILFGK
ncbi:hypothetical protein [Paenibacillus lutrae]|uniref:Uncharacterized protein n=1 Tax=Paenibacillus lutrae TaxID=2078573 RepID=A0A7X3K1S1_9BACL|nr:hypothetical protein [Paenibacillus lutrae]MVP02422.1 hypothetical protein [Paenibacillus lutrae]